MRELLEDIKLSRVAYYLEKIEKSKPEDKIKYFRKIEKKKITLNIGLFLIENSTRDFNFADNFGGINSSLIELCFSEYFEEYNEKIREVFPKLNENAQDRVLYLLTTIQDKSTLNLYTDLVVKYYKKREVIPIGLLNENPLLYPYLFPKLYKTLRFESKYNNILILISNYLSGGTVLKEHINKNKKILIDKICQIFNDALKYNYKDTYSYLNDSEYKKLRYFLEISINIEQYVSNKRTKELLTKLLNKNDNQLKLFILDNYYRNNIDIKKIKYNKIASDDLSRYPLYEILNIFNDTKLMPKKYLNQELLAKSDFLINFSIATNYQNKPKDLTFIKKITKNNYDYYVYKFKYTYKFNSYTTDYLTNYICSQVGLEKYNGEDVEAEFIGISGGFNKDKLSLVEKKHTNLLVGKLDNEEDIDKLIDELLVEKVIEEKELKKKKVKKEKKSKEKKKHIFKKHKKEEKIKVKKEKPIKEKKVKPYKEKIKKESHVFSYILLFLFSVYIGLLIYIILYIYGVGSINDSVNSEIIPKSMLEDKGSFTEIRASDIFNQEESEYFVLLYKGSTDKKDKYYTFINEYTKRDYRFYYVDLNNDENKFLYESNDLNFTIYTDRLLKVKDREYEYYVDTKKHILNEMENQIQEIIEKEKEEAKQNKSILPSTKKKKTSNKKKTSKTNKSLKIELKPQTTLEQFYIKNVH